MEQTLQTAVRDALVSMGAPDVLFAIEWPADLAHGDFATNAALAAAKVLGRSPRDIAEELAGILKDTLGSEVSSVEAAGPGFVNITLARATLANTLAAIGSDTEWGKGTEQVGRRVMIEYTQPNPFKEMHIGHLMSNTIGESVSRLVENSGAEIMRANYQGDVGPHVARALWGLQTKGITDPTTAEELGTAYVHGTRSYEESPKAKEEIDAINRAVYAGTDPEVIELWRKGREVSLAAFEDLYRVLGTKFDYYFYESETAAPGLEIVRKHVPDVFEESEGAIIYRGEKKGLHTLVFITSHGTPTYETKEIGLAFMKEERWPSDLSLITTSTEQIGHFKVVLAALEDVAPLLGAKTTHIPHGFLRFASGKMSSREGNIITATSLIKDVIEKTKEKNEDPLVAEQVAIAAIKYSILKSTAGSDIIFDFDKSLSLEGDSGPYLQYALVRAKSVIDQSDLEADTSDQPEETYDLERLVIRFPEVVKLAEAARAPHQVAQYLTQLASEWNSFYAQNRIRGGEHEAYKLALANAFVRTMERGLWLLGIPVPERM